MQCLFETFPFIYWWRWAGSLKGLPGCETKTIGSSRDSLLPFTTTMIALISVCLSIPSRCIGEFNFLNFKRNIWQICETVRQNVFVGRSRDWILAEKKIPRGNDEDKCFPNSQTWIFLFNYSFSIKCDGNRCIHEFVCSFNIIKILYQHYCVHRNITFYFKRKLSISEGKKEVLKIYKM